MVVLTNNSSRSNMYECRVLYIGSAPPIETLKGIEAMQEPLRQRYPSNVDQVEGIDANIRVLPMALEVTYLASGQVVHFPVDRLQICAGVRAVSIVDGTTGETSRQFVPVNNLQQESKHPAIFAAIIRRNKGRQINECHAFVCNSTRDALHLVNATATANMALKGQRTQRMRYESNNQENGVAVVHTAVVNGNGGTYRGTTRNYSQSNNEIYIGANVDTTMDSQHYQIDTPRSEAREPDPIYITFDKTNLRPKGDDTLELHTTYGERSRSPYVERRYVAPQPQRYAVVRAPVAPPPPQLVYARPPPPPQPVLVRAPPPPPVMVRPPPPRLYARRVFSPPPPMRYAAPAPVFVRTRARSASPIRYARSEFRPSGRETYQPKWSGRPASDSGFRQSRRDQFDQFLNERAFSRRMNADQRMNGPAPSVGYYPTAYDFQSSMLYDRPVTKSNPRYSSSDDDDDDRDNRFVRRSTRRRT